MALTPGPAGDVHGEHDDRRAVELGKGVDRGDGTPVITLRLFAAAREAAGTGHDLVSGTTVGAVLAEATARYGDPFAAVLAASRVWKNGEPAGLDTPVVEGDEVA